MKQYRLGFGYLLLPKQTFQYNNELIGGMCVEVLFQIFDENGKEVTFDEFANPLTPLPFDRIKTPIEDLITCCFDEEKLISLKPDIMAISRIPKQFSFLFKIEHYEKDTCEFPNQLILNSHIIEKDEFFNIMQANVELFNTRDNFPAQVPSYFLKELNDTDFKQNV